VDDDYVLLAGSASRHLGARIAESLGRRLGESEVVRFSEGNLFVRVGENVRGRDVFLIQGTAFPANDNFMELLFWIDALKRASAASVTAVMPYFSYAKGDKKDEPRVSIRARVCADAIQAAGADRVVSVDLHAPQVQGFFGLPVDDLYAMPVLCDANQRLDESPIERLFITDSVETQPAEFSTKVEVVSIAPLLSEAIHRIAHRESISVLFQL
jgi:ribose-phosphate pyrophosphokinase